MSLKPDNDAVAPEHTAVRVALWRALHVLIDPKPHVLTDEVGLKLVAEESWRDRQDMNPQFSKPMRASIVGRARFIEDLVEEQARRGVDQYVILGAHAWIRSSSAAPNWPRACTFLKSIGRGLKNGSASA